MKTATRHPTKPDEPPTPRQMEVYKLILKFFAEHGHAPTVLEVARLDGKDVPTAVSSQLQALDKKGWLDLPTDGKTRGVLVPKIRDETKALAASMEKATRGGKLKTAKWRSGGDRIQHGDLPTPLQARMYKLLLQFFARHGCPPTLRELVELAGATSTTIVVAHMRGLHKRGLVVVTKRAAKSGQKPRRQSRNLEVPKLRDATKTLATRLLAQVK